MQVLGSNGRKDAKTAHAKELLIAVTNSMAAAAAEVCSVPQVLRTEQRQLFSCMCAVQARQAVETAQTLAEHQRRVADWNDSHVEQLKKLFKELGFQAA